MIITIDGPAGSGKSTIAKLAAKKLNGVYLDTGAMYRSVTLTALEQGVSPDDEAGLLGIAEAIEIEFEEGGNGQKVFINGRDRTADIRTRAVDATVSTVSSWPGVREQMVAIQRRVGAEAALAVVEGRDTGSVVFPDADRKFYLDGDPAERARRRAAERGEQVDEHKIKEIVERDRQDSGREASPLTVPEGAEIIDTTNLSIDEVLQKIIQFPA